MCMTGTKVLIVEDAPSIALYIQTHLKQDGFIVDCVASKSEALAHVRTRRDSEFSYDVILADMALPDCEDGSIIRDLVAVEGCPIIIAMSADTDQETQLRARSMGAAQFFGKPFDIAKLKITLSKVKDEQTLAAKHTTEMDAASFSELTLSYRQYLSDVYLKIEKGLDGKALRTVLHQLRGSATLYNLPDLAKAAKRYCSENKADKKDASYTFLKSMATAIDQL